MDERMTMKKSFHLNFFIFYKICIMMEKVKVTF